MKPKSGPETIKNIKKSIKISTPFLSRFWSDFDLVARFLEAQLESRYPHLHLNFVGFLILVTPVGCRFVSFLVPFFVYFEGLWVPFCIMSCVEKRHIALNAPRKFYKW